MAQVLQIVLNHVARTRISDECRLFSTVRKPLNIRCGGVGGTGNRKGVVYGEIQGDYLPDNGQLSHQELM